MKTKAKAKTASGAASDRERNYANTTRETNNPDIVRVFLCRELRGGGCDASCMRKRPRANEDGSSGRPQLHDHLRVAGVSSTPVRSVEPARRLVPITVVVPICGVQSGSLPRLLTWYALACSPCACCQMTGNGVPRLRVCGFQQTPSC